MTIIAFLILVILAILNTKEIKQCDLCEGSGLSHKDDGLNTVTCKKCNGDGFI